MATMHVYLTNSLSLPEPQDAVIYGPSTTNKIERWWRDLHERLERFFKIQLSQLLRSGSYVPNNFLHRQILAYVYIPIIQRECDTFVTYWNNHRIRAQADLKLPTGVPNHMFAFPEQYDGEHKFSIITKDHLREVANVSNILSVDMEYMDANIMQQCSNYVPEPEKIESENAADQYLFLKENVTI